MSSINSVAGTNYSLFYDANAVGGVKLSRNTSEGVGAGDVVDMSDEAKILAQEIANMRSAESALLTTEERYAAAQNFGADFKQYLEGTGKLVRISGGLTDTSTTIKSKNGTIIGISAHGTSVSGEISAIYTAQITRKDGFQLNLSFNEDVRLNEHEDGGLTVFFAQSGITRHYDKDGNESVVENAPNTLGTDGDDIILNRHGTFVDAGAGNDTILNFAHGATILGGDGDDEILMADYVEGVTVDGGAGNDALYFNTLDTGTVIMSEGQDTLYAGLLRDSHVTSNSDNYIKAWNFHDSTLVSEKGQTHLSMGFSGGSTVQLSDEGNIVDVKTTYDDNISTGSGNDTVTIGGSMGSTINTGGGNDTVTVNRGLHGATVNLGDGDDTLTVAGNLFRTTINGGNGNDAITVNGGSMFSGVSGGSGDNAVRINGYSWFDSLDQSAVVNGEHRTIESLKASMFGSLANDENYPEMSPSELEALWRTNAHSIAEQFIGAHGPKSGASPLEPDDADTEALAELKKSVRNALGLGEKARPEQVVKAYVMEALKF